PTTRSSPWSRRERKPPPGLALRSSPPSIARPVHPPVTIIEPREGWPAPGLRELWSYRELLFFLVWRDVKVRYKQTALGASWAIIQPFFTMVVFSLFF